MLKVAAMMAVILGAPIAALAETATYEADSAHSHIGFSVRHLMLSNVKGEFTKYTVSVKGDPKDPTSAVVDVTIDTRSVNTSQAKRDEHLKSPDFFDVAKYPSMTFKSRKVVRAGKAGLRVTGDLTMRGATREVTLEVSGLVGPAKDPWGMTRVGLEATTTIDRRAFGLTWNKALEAGGVLVGNDVKIVLELELVQKAAPAK
jgi:polyisoprenoid-binding protein YceI